MKECVPDFEIDDDYALPSSSAPGGYGRGFARNKKTAIGDEAEIMELLWQNGQVVLQSQNQRPSSFKKSTIVVGGGGGGEEMGEIPQSTPTREIRSFDNVINMSHHQHQQQQQQLFMQEDEMASWLHYPISMDDSSFVDHRDLYPDDLLYHPPSTPAPHSSPPPAIHSLVAEIRPLTPPPLAVAPPPIPRPPATEATPSLPSRFQNFTHFSRMPKSGRIESGPSTSAQELTVVDSNEIPMVGTESRFSHGVEGESTAHRFSGENVMRGGTLSASAPTVGTSAGELAAACEPTVTSSPGASGGSASAEPPRQTIHNPSTSAADDWKRKRTEADDTEGHSEDIEFESADTKKQARGSTSTKRSRAAEVHNLSERRRRDRINERMKALQELIPRCNKSDKASMLDEAIEYLKSLQLQVQMMSMGCGMVPMMYPGVQQYMPPMGLGMGLGMDMGMNRPIMPYPSMMPPSGMPNPAVTAGMGQKYPFPAYHMPPTIPGSARMQAPNQMDPMLNPHYTHNPNQPQMGNFADPYHQFIGLHQAAHQQLPASQNQGAAQTSKPSNRGPGNPENHQSGQ